MNKLNKYAEAILNKSRASILFVDLNKYFQTVNPPYKFNKRYNYVPTLPMNILITVK